MWVIYIYFYIIYTDEKSTRINSDICQPQSDGIEHQKVIDQYMLDEARSVHRTNNKPSTQGHYFSITVASL